MEDLARRSASGFFWLLGNQALTRGFYTLALLVLGASFGPETFAPFAFVVVAVALSAALFEDLFIFQLVRSASSERNRQFRAARCYSLAIAALITSFVYPSTPWIAAIVGLPELEGLLRWSIVAVWAQAVQVTYLATLRLELKFRLQTLLAIPGALGTLVIVLVLQRLGGPTAALMAVPVGSACLQTALMMAFVNSAYHGYAHDPQAFRQFLRFGGRVYSANFLNIAFAGLYSLVISLEFSEAALGQYFFADRARELLILPFIGALQTVAFSALSRLREGSGDFSGAFRSSVALLSLVLAPISLAIACWGGAFVNLAAGEEWAPAGTYLAVMALATLSIPLHILNLTATKVIGRGDWLLRIEVAKKLIAIGVLLISVRWGVFGVVLGQLFMSFVGLVINGWYAGRGFGVPIARQLAICVPYLLLGVVAVCSAMMLNRVLAMNGWWEVILGSAITMLFYLTANIILRTDGITAGISIARSMLANGAPWPTK